mgnify:CR=1 FL=1
MEQFTKEKIIAKLNNLRDLKRKAICDYEYERAAELRDLIRKYTEKLEDLMNFPIELSETHFTKEEVEIKLHELKVKIQEAIARQQYDKVTVLKDEIKKYNVFLSNILNKNREEL